MRSVEQVQLKEIPERPYRLGSYPYQGIRRRYDLDGGGDRAGRPPARQAGRAGSWIADLGICSRQTMIKKVSNTDSSRTEFRKLVAQYSILVVIAGIVSWLIVVSG
jgi:hypothetical protein